MNIKNRMRMLVLGVLTLAAFIPTFAQNIFPLPQNDKDVKFQEQVEHFPTYQPTTGQPIIINNYPPQQQPVIQPKSRPIYQPSVRRIDSPVPAKKDTIYVVSQPAVHQSSFLSENGIIWCIIVLGLVLFCIIGYLIGRPKRSCYENCNGCRGGNCGSRDLNVQGHIDHGHNGIPTKVTHIHTHSHTGIPTEITLKAEMPPKVEEKPVEQK